MAPLSKVRYPAHFVVVDVKRKIVDQPFPVQNFLGTARRSQKLCKTLCKMLLCNKSVAEDERIEYEIELKLEKKLWDTPVDILRKANRKRINSDGLQRST